MYQHGMIAPVVALVAWSLVMWVWLYATRIPAMSAAKIKPGDLKSRQELDDKLPKQVGWVAQNYNHLMEQPTIFYAICFALQFLDQTHPINIGLAWTYVVLRIVHSLVQATINIIPLRFLIFTLSSLALAALTFHAFAAMDMLPFHLPHGG